MYNIIAICVSKIISKAVMFTFCSRVGHLNSEWTNPKGGRKKKPTLHQIYKKSYLYKIYVNYKVTKMKGELFNKTKASLSQKDTFKSVVLF